MKYRQCKERTLWLERLIKPGTIAGNSGELNAQLGGDDTTCICAGTVADKSIYYFCNL
jgi:hypothetical protein